MSGLLCAGDVYIDRLTDGGASTGLRKIGNATLLSLQESTETVQRTSKQRDSYGQALDTVQIKQPTQLAMTLDEIDKENLAFALLGEAATQTITGASITDEAVTAKLDRWVPLAHRDVSTVVVQDATDTTTYVAGTDYEIEARLGWIRALPGGAITDDEVLHVDYAYASATIATVAGASKPLIRAKLILDGKNLANGDQIIVTIDETTLSPNSAVDFLAGEFVSLEMSGSPKTLAGKTSPYGVEIKASA